jgi:hypothetical protein
LCLYHRERMNTAPGKNVASTNPRKKRKMSAVWYLMNS